MYDMLKHCLGNKIDFNNFDHDKFSEFLRDKLSNVKKPLYRGITIEELLHNKFVKGEKLELNRVTSFSTDGGIASTFACERYKTNVLLKINNANAFFYSGEMVKILDKMIEDLESEDNADENVLNDLYDKIGMVDYEEEYLIPAKSVFIITNITKTILFGEDEIVVVELE